jgi:hypothetical protein
MDSRAGDEALLDYLSCCAEYAGRVNPIESLQDSLESLFQQFGFHPEPPASRT